MITSLVSRLRNSRISYKLSLGFGVVLLLVALATALSVVRFNAIRHIYEKTNLVYDINIEVFQAKINRLKYLYNGDEKSGKVMSGFVTHASQLTQQANQLDWAGEQKQIINDIAAHLDSFQSSITAMTAATQKLAALRTQLNSNNSKDLSASYTLLIGSPLADQAITSALFTQLLAISQIREEAYVLTFSASDALRQSLNSHFASAQSAMADLMAQLPVESQRALQSLWNDAVSYKQLSEEYQASYAQLRAAEDSVKTAGDKSSASIKQIMTLVKAEDDSLTFGSARIMLMMGALAILFGILVAWSIIRQITRPVRQNLALAERIASGDLSSEFHTDRDDELGQLTAAMGRMNQRLRTVIGDVRDSVITVAHASSSINSGNTDLSTRTEQQAAAVVETAASMEQLTSTVKNNADNARHASQIAAQASKTAIDGGAAVRDVVKTMGDISASSKKIADITAVINSIAFQTNILALNAAVEAARAGEQGRGFAVVASEVRNLSQRSSQAAKDIAQLISESESRIDNGNLQVARAGDTMENVVSAITRVNDIMGEISSASEEQSRGIEQIARAVSELDTTTQQNASLVSASSISANALEEQAVLLENLVNHFRLERRA
ncbi:methyl-accepting chemotaxis protein [Erwiniaceae bacterium BAC15a-03b]|uniref:Methyl-accepting chemotaxis protein n=1 Tax=Winslowiella arboricola TaxID=2978220 RepID=A0A9J6PVJ6_9GAMM|nr:methyl-accepting chemotaxis protein [Winslowiella arboricola]MCU5771076.1 methyl-accepting chemotaxis protein [Winslowiella arboricola]MCU5779717.1 methyl-accepting chemotaxis protein [Winslowiella arboricola]